MANLLIGTCPILGHVNPLVPIARTLVERGHRVLWCTGADFREKVEATGAAFSVMADGGIFSEPETGPLVDRLKLTGLAQMKYDMKHLFVDQAKAQIPDLRRHLAEFPAELVIADTLCLGPLFLSELDGPPCVICGMSILGLRSCDTAPFGTALPPDASPLGRVRNAILGAFAHTFLLRDLRTYTNRMRRELGLRPVSYPFFDLFLHVPALYLQPTAPSFEYPRSDLPEHVQFIGPLLPDPPADFTPSNWWGDLDTDRPVVLVTQGTVMTDPEQLIRPVLRALADEQVLVVATTGGTPPDDVRADAPPNARIEEFISYQHLLPKVDVMVTNAGYGGVQFALAHGVPLVVAGRTEEKPEVCARVAWSGAGIDLKTHTPTETQAREAVVRVLQEPGFRENARRIQSDMAQLDAPNEAADRIEALTAAGKRKNHGDTEDT